MGYIKDRNDSSLEDIEVCGDDDSGEDMNFFQPTQPEDQDFPDEFDSSDEVVNIPLIVSELENSSLQQNWGEGMYLCTEEI